MSNGYRLSNDELLKKLKLGQNLRKQEKNAVIQHGDVKEVTKRECPGLTVMQIIICKGGYTHGYKKDLY